MTAHAVESAVGRVVARRPDLELPVRAVAMGLNAGEGVDMIHQAALQQQLWWYLPRDCPEEDWRGLVGAAAALLAELGLAHLAQLASCETTEKVLAAWARSRSAGAAAFQSAHATSGVEPAETARITWGSVMGMDESTATTAVELALGAAVAAGELVPGTPRWQAKAAAITDAVLSRPLDLPPGQTLAGMVTTGRVPSWITVAGEGVLAEWRAGVANRLLHPIAPPPGAAQAMAPLRWLLELAAASGGAELTQSFYLARTSVREAAERFGWWEWEKPPRSEADVYQLTALRAAGRLRLVRRSARRLHTTQRGSELLAQPDRLWELIATETEDGSDFIAMVAEVLGLGLLRGRVRVDELSAEVGAILRWVAGRTREPRCPRSNDGERRGSTAAGVAAHRRRSVRRRRGARAARRPLAGSGEPDGAIAAESFTGRSPPDACVVVSRSLALVTLRLGNPVSSDDGQGPRASEAYLRSEKVVRRKADVKRTHVVDA